MSSLRAYLESPQFPDEEPPSEEELSKGGFSVARFTGGWVAPGQPRWKALVIFISSIVGGVILAIPAPGDLDVFAIVGVVFIAFGIYGLLETLRGKRFLHP